MKFRILITLLTLGLLLPTTAFAQTNETYYEYTLTPYIKFADNIVISAPADSDQYLVGDNVVINDDIKGDVFIIANKAEINADIVGDVRGIIGENIDIKSTIDGSVSIIGGNVHLYGNSDIKNDVYGIMTKLVHEGRIGGDLNISPNEDVTANITGKILGNVFYTKSRPIIEGRGNIEGHISNIPNPVENKSQNDDQKALLFFNLYHSLSLLLIFIIIRHFYKAFLEKAANQMNTSIGKLLITGFVFIFFMPFLLLLGIISFIGIPLTAILFTLLTIIWYISPIFAATFISNKLFNQNYLGLIQFSLSLLLFDLISIAPILGIIISVISIVLAFGIVGQNILIKRKINE